MSLFTGLKAVPTQSENAKMCTILQTHARTPLLIDTVMFKPTSAASLARLASLRRELSRLAHAKKRTRPSCNFAYVSRSSLCSSTLKHNVCNSQRTECSLLTKEWRDVFGSSNERGCLNFLVVWNRQEFRLTLSEECCHFFRQKQDLCDNSVTSFLTTLTVVFTVV